jgi:hypothetical protein
MADERFDALLTAFSRARSRRAARGPGYGGDGSRAGHPGGRGHGAGLPGQERKVQTEIGMLLRPLPQQAGLEEARVRLQPGGRALRGGETFLQG